MIDAQKSKYAIAISPAAIVDNASATATAVDTDGYDYAEVIVSIGATDIAAVALKVTECDTSGGTYTDVSGAEIGTDTDIAGTATTLPSATDDDTVVVFQVNLLGLKRYLKVVATSGDGTAGTFWAAVVRLSRGDQPTTNAEAGALAVVRA